MGTRRKIPTGGRSSRNAACANPLRPTNAVRRGCMLILCRVRLIYWTEELRLDYVRPIKIFVNTLRHLADLRARARRFAQDSQSRTSIRIRPATEPHRQLRNPERTTACFAKSVR